MKARVVAIALLAQFLAALLPVPRTWAQPTRMSYQGELLKNGSPFTGSASMKAAIVHVPNGQTLWSNDGTSINGSEPTSSFAVSVQSGLFTVWLGDSGSGMQPLTADALAPTTGDVNLLVWIDTGNGFEAVVHPLMSSAYALQSDAARRAITNFTVGGNLGVGTQNPTQRLEVSTGNILVRGLGNFDTSGEQASLFLGDTNHYLRATHSSGLTVGTYGAPDAICLQQNTGNVGIGTLNPTAKLHVNGVVQMQGLQLEGTTASGWVLTSDATGAGSWQPAGGGADSDWIVSANDMYSGVSGNVGIGTSSPSSKLQVEGTVKSQELEATNWFKLWTNGYESVRIYGNSVTGAGINIGGPGGQVSDPGLRLSGGIPSGGGQVLAYNGAGSPTIEIDGESTGGGLLAMSNGSGLTVQVRGNGNGSGGDIQAWNASSTMTYRMRAHAYAGGSQLELFDSAGVVGVQLTSGNREMKLFDDTGTNTVWITGQDGGGNGRVRTGILEITGGADLSERFDIATGSVPLEPGMVVSIDPHNPGQLVVSDEAYQRTVAGIVSGAGGVRPGMLMGQAGTTADGRHPVALTGRVWTWCDASSAAIGPGDLLTTSSMPGHAMKVRDFARSQGAILGKAMSSLDKGRGLVLVLVSLQ